MNRTIESADEAFAPLARGLANGLRAANPDLAMQALTAELHGLLGIQDADLKPGGLLPGEKPLVIAGIEMVSADRQEFIFIAERNFPAHQHRQRIPIGTGHQALVMRTKKSVISEDLHKDPVFVQVLSAAKMGSLIMAPMMWEGKVMGMVFTASQARRQFRPLDLTALEAFADAAAMLWVAHDGPRLLEDVLSERPLPKRHS